MKTYHVLVQRAERGWLAAHALEDDSVHTQGRSLDEIAQNIREVASILHGEEDVQLELVLPGDIKVPAKPPSKRARQSRAA
jgi:predicted RNase H-like HicB family nuclease